MRRITATKEETMVRFVTTLHRGTGLFGSALLVLVVQWLLSAATPVLAAEAGRDTLTALGLEFEAARLAAQVGERSGAEAMARALGDLPPGQFDASQKAAAALLRGWTELVAGDAERAAKEFERARDAADDDALEAAAAFLKVEALEAQGDDQEAAKRWERWLRDHGKTTLAPEARLHMVWNNLRRGELAAAQEGVKTLTADAAWMADDPRCVLAQATVAFLGHDHAAALATLERKGDGAGATPLRSRCGAVAGWGDG